MEIADQIVRELAIEHFFNIQLVGEHVIEINPRISTIVYQEDLNLPYLGVKRALGEISDDELAGCARGSGRAGRPALLRPGRVGRPGRRLPRARAWLSAHCGSRTARSTRPGSRGRTCRRCAGAASTRGSSSSSATGSTPRPTGRSTRQEQSVAQPAGAAGGGARAPAAADRRLPLLLRPHARPEAVQFPLLRAARKKSVMHYLGSDIRGKTPEQLAYGKQADAQVVGSYDAIRWVPEAEVIPPGVDLARIAAGAAVRPRPAGDRPRALLAPAQGHRARDRGRRGARRRARDRRGPPPRRGPRALPGGRHRRRPAERRLVRPVRDRGDGARQAGRDLPARRGRPAHRGGVRHARPDRLRDRGDAPRDAPPARRRRGTPARLGAAWRAYVEQVHDLDRVADRLLDLYARL